MSWSLLLVIAFLDRVVALSKPKSKKEKSHRLIWEQHISKRGFPCPVLNGEYLCDRCRILNIEKIWSIFHRIYWSTDRILSIVCLAPGDLPLGWSLVPFLAFSSVTMNIKRETTRYQHFQAITLQ